MYVCRIILICIACFFFRTGNSQYHQTKAKLPKELKEISGLEKFNDTILIAINDSGNSPDIYFLNLKGEILKKSRIVNASNVDWEDLTMDDDRNLYIADVGNNYNARKDLCVLKIKIDQAFEKSSVNAEKIYFSYENQNAFPPDSDQAKFDCESIFWSNDSLHLITKNTSKKPFKFRRRSKTSFWDRLPEEYILSDQPGTYVAKISRIQFPYVTRVRSKGIKDLVTSVDVNGGVVVVLTYSQLRIMKWPFDEKSENLKCQFGQFNFDRLTQKEAIVIIKPNNYMVAAEGNLFLGGPYLYTITIE